MKFASLCVVTVLRGSLPAWGAWVENHPTVYEDVVVYVVLRMGRRLRCLTLRLACKLQELEDMFGDADGAAVLVCDLDFCDGFARFFIH